MPPLSSGGIFGAPATPLPTAPAPFLSTDSPGMAPVGGSSAGASEFTRMLGAIAPPKGPAAPPALPVAPPAAAPPAASGQQGGGSIKAYLPLILALNVVLIAAATAILYFLLKR